MWRRANYSHLLLITHALTTSPRTRVGRALTRRRYTRDQSAAGARLPGGGNSAGGCSGGRGRGGEKQRQRAGRHYRLVTCGQLVRSLFLPTFLPACLLLPPLPPRRAARQVMRKLPWLSRGPRDSRALSQTITSFLPSLASPRDSTLQCTTCISGKYSTSHHLLSPPPPTTPHTHLLSRPGIGVRGRWVG